MAEYSKIEQQLIDYGEDLDRHEENMRMQTDETLAAIDETQGHGDYQDIAVQVKRERGIL